MPKRVRNPHGVVSVVPDDYPSDLIRQLGLVEETEDGTTPQAPQSGPGVGPEPEPQKRSRRK